MLKFQKFSHSDDKIAKKYQWSFRMKKVISLLIIFNFFSLQVWALTPQEEACKKFVEEEMYTRGLVNKRVCLNTNNYPNISINTSLSDIQSGKSNKPLKPEDIKAMAGLENLLNGALADVKDAHKEVVGYTDGEIAVYSSFDNQFFKMVDGKTPVAFQDSQKTGASYSLQLDETKVKSYIAGIKDPVTKAKLDELMKTKKSSSVNFNKIASGEGIEYYPSGDNQLLVDILRNHALSIKRTEDFCDKTGNPVECKKNQKGVTSVDLLEKSRSATDKTLANYNGKCGGRRGVSYNFYFPDEVKKKTELEPGVYEPSFNIPGRDFQNNIQLAAAMDYMRKLQSDKTSFPELDSKSVLAMEKSKLFNDYDGDRARFKEWLKKQGSKCADNEYQVENQRRLFWAMGKEVLDTKTVLKKDKSPKKEDYEAMIDLIQSGDFANLKQNPEFNNVYSLATKPYPHTQDYLEMLKDEMVVPVKLTKEDQTRLNNLRFYKSKGHMDGSPITKAELAELNSLEAKTQPQDITKDKSLMSMVLLMRTMVVGRPVKHKDLTKTVSDNDAYNRFLIYDGTVTRSQVELDIMAKFDGKPSPLEKEYTRYTPNDHYATDVMDIGYAPADVYACHDVSDALVENMQTEKSALVNGLGRTGEEDKDENTWDEIRFSPTSVKTVETLNSKVGFNLSKKGEWKRLEDEGYLEKGNYSETSIKTTGWVCQECGSGIHVHSDGSVHPVSRQKEGPRNLSKEANQTFDVTKDDNFSMSSLQHLKVYVLNNCQNCDCVKDFKNGNDFKNKLASAGEVHNMITYNENNQPVIDPKKNAFKVEDPKSCMYVAPVPHSCNFDPTGESAEKKKNREVRESLYCKLKTIIQSDEFSTQNPKIIELKASDSQSIMQECQKSIFPQTEASCLDKFLKKGVNVATPVEGSSTKSN
jgi:hypothetical protein